MHTVLDKGPRPPVAPEDKDDAVAAVAYKAAVKEHDDWHKAHPEPIQVRMHGVDARAAIIADPERYSEIGRDAIVRKGGSDEERITNLEERMTDLENEVWPPAEKPPVVEPKPAPTLNTPIRPYPESKLV